eukprot:597545-Prorocentrum_minimum.AAC.5
MTADTPSVTHEAEKIEEVKKILLNAGLLDKVDETHTPIERFLTADHGNVGRFSRPIFFCRSESRLAPSEPHPCVPAVRLLCGTLFRTLRQSASLPCVGMVTSKASKRLIQTIKWRETSLPNPLICKHCAKDHKSHYLHPVGFDKQGRPVIYSVFSLANDRKSPNNVEHMIHCFENTISLMGPKVTQWVWISDFTGFGVRNMNPQIALAANHLFSACYPERLGLFVILGAPGIFDTLYKTITPVLDPHTANKVSFCKRDPENMRKCFSEHFDEELTSWMLTEIAQNADKNLRSKKVYAGTSINGAGRFDEADQSPMFSPAALVDGHNPYGTQSFVEAIKVKPLEWQRAFLHYAPREEKV